MRGICIYMYIIEICEWVGVCVGERLLAVAVIESRWVGVGGSWGGDIY